MVRRVVVGFLRQALPFGGVVIEQQGKTRGVGSQFFFFGRAFMQSLRGEREIRQVVTRAVNLIKGIERFATSRRVLRHALPELFGFRSEIPFGR